LIIDGDGNQDRQMPIAEVLWHCAALNSAEHCVLSETETGWQIRGLTVTPMDGAPAHIEFDIDADRDWLTRTARVQFHGPRAFAFDIRSDDGAWTVNGDERKDLAGCTDIDLGWTPATNILPIRRLQLNVGATGTTTAAWFRFPDLVIEANQQRYTRTGDHLWRYQSGPYDFDITVDEHGLVTQYGEDLWRAAARRG